MTERGESEQQGSGNEGLHEAPFYFGFKLSGYDDQPNHKFKRHHGTNIR